jgi:hypothetical protein
MADAPVGLREVARFVRGTEQRSYGLRAAPEGAELWRITEAAGQPPEPVLETTLDNIDQALTFLEELDRTLKAGGWTVAHGRRPST